MFLFAAKDGFRYVEIIWYHHDCDLPAIAELQQQNGLRLSSRTAIVSLPFVTLNIQEYLHEVRQSLQIAKQLGMSGVALHSNVIAADGAAAVTFPQDSNTANKLFAEHDTSTAVQKNLEACSDFLQDKE